MFTRDSESGLPAGGVAERDVVRHVVPDDLESIPAGPVPTDGLLMGINYGFDKIRFLAPVRAGKRVRAHAEVIGVEQKDDNRFLVRQAVSVEIEGEETPALVAEWLSMVVTG